MKYRLEHLEWFFEQEPKHLYELGFTFNEVEEGWVMNVPEPIYIEFKTLEELQAFIEKYGNISLSEDSIKIWGIH